MRARGAAFDLDGTLADTSADLIRAANATLARLGASVRLDPARDQGIAGRGGRAMLRAGLERSRMPWVDAEIAEVYPTFLADYEAGIAEETRLFEGVERCLDALAEHGWRLGVCTNKPTHLAEALLAALGVRDRFAAVLGADSLPVRKPDPLHLWATFDRIGADRGASVLIGDTDADARAAAAAGAPFVLVDFGLSADPPGDLAAAAVVRDFASLPAVLGRLSPRLSTGPSPRPSRARSTLDPRPATDV